MVLPLLGTRRPESLPAEALEGRDDILKLAITERNSGALLSLRCEGAQVEADEKRAMIECEGWWHLHVACTCERFRAWGWLTVLGCTYLLPTQERLPGRTTIQVTFFIFITSVHDWKNIQKMLRYDINYGQRMGYIKKILRRKTRKRQLQTSNTNTGISVASTPSCVPLQTFRCFIN